MLRFWSCLEGQHDWRLVLLAAFVCLLTALAAMKTLQRAGTDPEQPSIGWLLTSGIMTGCGVWATHFIAILAYTPGFAFDCNVALTAVSLVVVTVLTTVGFAVTLGVRNRIGGVLGGLLVGLAIVGMHFTGIAALQMPAEVVWSAGQVCASIVLGVGFAVAAMCLAQRGRAPIAIVSSGGLLALSIVSHHFVAMSAIELIPQALSDVGLGAESRMVLSVEIAVVMTILTIACVISMVVDRRNQERLRQRNIQLDAALNNMSEGLCMFDRAGHLQLCNARYLEIFRLPPGSIQPGCSVADMLAARRAAGTHFTSLEAVETSDTSPGNHNDADHVAELIDGRVISVSRRPLPDGGWVTTHTDITHHRQTERRIAHLAHHDPMTGLANRAAFDLFISSTFRDCADTQSAFAIIRIDLDRFRQVNDMYGHAAGDDVICAVAKRLKQTSPGAFIARLGGDEFTIVSTSGPQPATAEDICARVLSALDEEFRFDDRPIRIGGTIGVSIYPTDAHTAQTLLLHADAALERAKSKARGSVCFFEPMMDQAIRERRDLQRDLIAAVHNNELEIYFQPQATADGGIFAFEALLRWIHPARGAVSPMVFIPLAEETGLIGAIDAWVLREACREAASWPNPLGISVNLSPMNFRSRDVPAMIGSVLTDTGLDPARLEIEITEGVLIDDAKGALAILHKIRDRGVRIAMDDFGTGYSSLAYLQSFPFDKIKIDRSFVMGIEGNSSSAPIVQAIIGLAHALNLPVIAEGVETSDQHRFLIDLGCTQMQGYLIGRPKPIGHYRDLVCPIDVATMSGSAAARSA